MDLNPVYQEPTVTVYAGDSRKVLRLLPSDSIDCCVTSPPYFGLRDYGTASWEGGDSICDHIQSEIRTGMGLAALGEKYAGGGHKQGAIKGIPYKDICGKCGAARVDEQIGLEKTPDEYVAELVKVFREVRRVLRDDGTLWLNLGDSYARSGGTDRQASPTAKVGNSRRNLEMITNRNQKISDGLKEKDLIGIPWRVAFALQADGWYLRQDIIWHKPNPMPESVTDRCTKAHEYIFLLSKSQKYHFDSKAIKEPVKGDWGTRDRANGKYHNEGTGIQPHSGLTANYESANKRSVWTVSTKPYAGAHFATFPPDLIEPCIMAGCPPGGTVLDPFTGSGTTLEVSRALGRHSIGVELGWEKYGHLIRKRLEQQCLPIA